MEIIKLIGVLIVVIGFILKLDTLAVVVVAGLATGLVAGMSPMDILNTLGTAFITNRTATLFILTLPVIGLCERNGLKDKAVDFIRSLKNMTTGKLIAIWQVIRTFASAFSLRVGGHPQFIRPLILWPRQQPLYSTRNWTRNPKTRSKECVPEVKTTATSLHKTVSWDLPELF